MPTPHRAGTAAVRRTGRNGSAPSTPRATTAARAFASRRRRLQMDPLVQRACASRVGREIIDELRDAWIAPRALEVRPDLRDRLRAQVAADEGQGVDQLHQ